MLTYQLPDAWEQALTGWLAWLRLGGASKATVRQRRGCVRMMARRSKAARPSELTFAAIVRVSSQFEWSNEHRKGVRTALVSFYDWCIDNGHADFNPAENLPKVAGEKPKPRPVPDTIWADLLAQATPRERMMARLACELGMRRAEVAVARGDDLVVDAGGWALIVHGKGGKQRVLPVPDELAVAIQRYAEGRPGYLFPGQINGHISPQHAGKLISKLMPKGWTMHKLRHRFATVGFAGTKDIMAVKEALGHASVATTQIYTAVAATGVRAVTEAAASESVSSSCSEAVACAAD